MVIQNKRVVTILSSIGLLLLIPFIAMQFTDQVNWALSDFIIAAALLLITGFLGEMVFRKVNKSQHRIAIWLVILAAFLLIWAELAVGIFGTPLAGS